IQAEDGIRDSSVTGVQTCALPISDHKLLATRDLRPYAKSSLWSRHLSKRTRTRHSPLKTESKTRVANERPQTETQSFPHTVGVRSEERRVGKECRCASVSEGTMYR